MYPQRGAGDDGVAFRIERNGADRRPIARVPRPARWIAFASLLVDGVPGGEDRVIVARVSLRGADVSGQRVCATASEIAAAPPQADPSILAAGRVGAVDSHPFIETSIVLALIFSRAFFSTSSSATLTTNFPRKASWQDKNAHFRGSLRILTT
jgi:hypothetical protein